MKILLRDYYGENYVWKTAKYNNRKFYVEGDSINEINIVSIINDNRKNYIECSCCGQVFRRGDVRFEIHKANAIKPETCFDCCCLIADAEYVNKTSYAIDPNGNFIRKIEEDVTLRCSNSGIWSYDRITSDSAIQRCKKRQCADAEEVNIVDFFTVNPGAFDDILTIDSLLDQGYDVRIDNRGDWERDIIVEDDYTIGVNINKLGIVDHFYVWFNGDKDPIYYSNKHKELLTNAHQSYVLWRPLGIEDEVRKEIKAHIENFYR